MSPFLYSACRKRVVPPFLYLVCWRRAASSLRFIVLQSVMALNSDGVGTAPIALDDLAAQLLETQQRLAQFEAEQLASRQSGESSRVDAYRTPKIPSFFRSDPELWFMQAETTMRNARITVESTKADVVLGALDVEVFGCVKDIMAMSPPPGDIYQRVKARIIATFADSGESTLRKLLKGEVASDGKPSLVLSRLRNLNKDKCNDAVIRSVFLDQVAAGHRAFLLRLGPRISISWPKLRIRSRIIRRPWRFRWQQPLKLRRPHHWRARSLVSPLAWQH